MNFGDFGLAAAEVVGGLTAIALAARVAISSVYVRTDPYQSKVIAGFGGDLKRATVQGGSWKKPFERVAFTIDQTLQVTDFPVNIRTQEEAGNNFVDLPVQIHYEISDPMKSARLPDEARRKQVMQTLAQNVIRSHFAEKTLQEVYTSKSDIAAAVKAELEENMRDYGLTIRDVVVENPTLEPKLQESIQAVTIAERTFAAAKLNAESVKVTAMGKAEGEQAVLMAQANGKKALLIAEAEGQGAIRIAAAEAEEKARLALGRGIAGEQKEIAEGLAVAIKTLKEPGVSPDKAMDYFQGTNQGQYTKQNIEALVEGYKGIEHAILFADMPNPASFLAGADVSVGGSSGAHDVKDIVRIVAALDAARRPEFTGAAAEAAHLGHGS